MERPKGFALVQVTKHIADLENDPSHELSAGTMQTYLGRDYSTYAAEIANRGTFIPYEALSDFGRKYADDTADLMKRITFALNFKDITIDGSATTKQRERLDAFMGDAEELLQIYHNEFEYDPERDIPQPYLSDRAFLVSYHEDGVSRPYDRAYQALENYEVYLPMRPDDSQVNQALSVNFLQRRWLETLIEEPQPELDPARLDRLRALAKRDF